LPKNIDFIGKSNNSADLSTISTDKRDNMEFSKSVLFLAEVADLGDDLGKARIPSLKDLG
jgi:hypothetical protein